MARRKAVLRSFVYANVPYPFSMTVKFRVIRSKREKQFGTV